MTWFALYGSATAACLERVINPEGMRGVRAKVNNRILVLSKRGNGIKSTGPSGEDRVGQQ